MSRMTVGNKDLTGLMTRLEVAGTLTILRDSNVSRETIDKSVYYDLDEAYVFLRGLVIQDKFNIKRWTAYNRAFDAIKQIRDSKRG